MYYTCINMHHTFNITCTLYGTVLLSIKNTVLLYNKCNINALW